MKSDRTWQLILLAGALAICVIVYKHVRRDRPPHDTIHNMAPDGTEFVTPVAKDAAKRTDVAADDELPARAADEDQDASRKAWMSGDFELLPSEPGLLVVENGFERRKFLESDSRVMPCRSQKAMCLYGPDFEGLITEKLPSRFRPKGSSDVDRRMAPPGMSVNAFAARARAKPSANSAGKASAKPAVPPAPKASK